MSPRIAAYQFEPVVGDITANLEAIRGLGADLSRDVELVVLPEFCITGYALEHVPDLATPVPGPVINSLVDLAGELECMLAAGLPEREGDDYYNTTVLVSPDGLEATYRKQYSWGVESEVFTAGEGPTTAETPVGRIGLCCCYDLNFPEVCLEYARRECDVIAVNAAWRTSFLDDWRLLSRARARDGPFYVVASNHIGDQHGREHAGHSLIVGPDGHIRCEADETAALISASVITNDLKQARERNPVFKTRVSRGDW